MSTQPNTTDLDRLEAKARKGDYITRAEQLELIALARHSQPVAALSVKTWDARQRDSKYSRTAEWCMLAEIADLRAALATQQAAREQQEPVAWECRHYDAAGHPGGWGEWERVTARGLSSVADRVAEIRRYIAEGYKYELRALYAAPVAQQSEAARIDWPAIRATLANVIAVASVRITDKDADDEALLDKADKALAELDRYVRAAQPTEAGAPTAAASVLPEGFEAMHIPHDDMMTAEWNAKNRFIVRRIAAPFCGKDSIRQWSGPTLPAALETACAALGIAPTSGRESAAPAAPVREGDREQDAKDAASENRPAEWALVTQPGQVKVGDSLCFTIGDKPFIERVKIILHAGTDKEEVIYNRKRNFYFITAMVMSGFSSHKNVQFRAAMQKGAQA